MRNVVTVWLVALCFQAAVPVSPRRAGGGWRRTWGGGDRAGPGRFGGVAGGRREPPGSPRRAGYDSGAVPCPALPGGLRGLFVLAAGSSPGCPGSPNSNQTRCGRSRPAGGSAPLRCGAGGAAREPPAGAREPLGAPGNGAGGWGGRCSRALSGVVREGASPEFGRALACGSLWFSCGRGALPRVPWSRVTSETGVLPPCPWHNRASKGARGRLLPDHLCAQRAWPAGSTPGCLLFLLAKPKIQVVDSAYESSGSPDARARQQPWETSPASLPRPACGHPGSALPPALRERLGSASGPSAFSLPTAVLRSPPPEHSY